MKAFYRKTFVICLSLALILMIIGSAAAANNSKIVKKLPDKYKEVRFGPCVIGIDSLCNSPGYGADYYKKGHTTRLISISTGAVVNNQSVNMSLVGSVAKTSE